MHDDLDEVEFAAAQVLLLSALTFPLSRARLRVCLLFIISSQFTFSDDSCVASHSHDTSTVCIVFSSPPTRFIVASSRLRLRLPRLKYSTRLLVSSPIQIHLLIPPPTFGWSDANGSVLEQRAARSCRARSESGASGARSSRCPIARRWRASSPRANSPRTEYTVSRERGHRDRLLQRLRTK